MKQPFSLFANIKRARIASGLSQRQLAKKLGLSDKTVSAYETGRAIPPTQTLTKIAKLTKTPLQELIGIKEKNGEEKLYRKLSELTERISNLEQLLIKLTKEK